MFARQCFRSATALRTHVRRYASETTKSEATTGTAKSNTPFYGLGVLLLAGAGYYAYNQTARKSPMRQQTDGTGDKSSTPANKVFKGGDQGFISLLLENVEEINHNTKRFRFKLPDENDVSGLQVASALITKYKGPEMEKPVIRPYTPVSDEDARGYLEFVIKRYPKGPMSQHLHSMTPGQRLDFKGPIPKYPWSPNKHEHIVLIAGGTGITPMYQLARAIFKNPDDQTKVTLVFGNISEEDILLRKEFDALENTYPRRFRAFYTLDNPPEGWPQGTGYVTKELLKTVMPEPKEGEKIKIFVCGPPGMYKAISGPKKSPTDQGELDGILKELGYDKEQVYKF